MSNLLDLPSVAWNRLLHFLPPESVASLGVVSTETRNREQEVKTLIWDAVIRRELRQSWAPTFADPKKTFGAVRNPTRSCAWFLPDQPETGPRSRNGGGFARLGSGDEFVLFGGSKHKTSRTSSSLCNEVAILRIKEESARCPDVNDDAAPSTSGHQHRNAGEPGKSPEQAPEQPAVRIEWDEAPEIHGRPPSPRWGHSFTSVTDTADGQDAILVYGGFGGGAILEDAHLLKRSPTDPTALLWQELGPGGDRPGPSAFHSATQVAPGVVLVMGGLGHSSTSENFALLDLATRTWHHPDCDPGPLRAGHASSFVPVLSGQDHGEALLGHVWIIGGCSRNSDEDEYFSTVTVLEVSAGHDDTPCKVRLRRLGDEQIDTLECLEGRNPLYERVGRHIFMWGGFFPHRPNSFDDDWTIIDTESRRIQKFKPKLHPSVGSRAPEAREGGQCVAVARPNGMVGLLVFGGATFSRRSNLKDVHLLLLSEQ